MTRSGVRGVRSLQHQDRQHQGMIKCMDHYAEAAPLQKNQYVKLMNHLQSSSTTTATTAFMASKLPKTTNPSKFAGVGGLVFHALPSSSSSSSSEEKVSNAVVFDKMKKKIGSSTASMAMNHRFVTWRVEDHNKGKGLNYSGVSATELAGRLSGDFWDDQIDDDEYEEEEEVVDLENRDLGLDDPEIYPHLPVKSVNVCQVKVIHSKVEAEDENQDEDAEANEDGEEDDDHMSFCEVEYVIDQLDDDGDEVDWCLVNEY